jgi:hypothetical protein
MFLRTFGNHSPIGTVTSQKIEISVRLFNLDNCKQTSHSHIQYNPNTNNMQTIKIALCTIKLRTLFFFNIPLFASLVHRNYSTHHAAMFREAKNGKN